MAQTTGAMSAVANKVEISANGSSWTDISGFGTSVESSELERQSGESYTFDGDTAIVTYGKLGPIDVTVNGLFTEGTGDPFEVVRGYAQAAGGSTVYVRWSPAGGTAGKFQFATSASKVTTFKFPDVDASSGDPVPFTFTVRAASITKSVVSS